MDEAKREQYLIRLYDAVEMMIASDLPKDQKVACIEALYVAYCTAVGKKINYELLKH